MKLIRIWESTLITGLYSYKTMAKSQSCLKSNNFFLSRVKYVMINQTELDEFGLVEALLRMLEKKVINFWSLIIIEIITERNMKTFSILYPAN